MGGQGTRRSATWPRASGKWTRVMASKARLSVCTSACLELVSPGPESRMLPLCRMRKRAWTAHVSAPSSPAPSRPCGAQGGVPGMSEQWPGRWVGRTETRGGRPYSLLGPWVLGPRPRYLWWTRFQGLQDGESQRRRLRGLWGSPHLVLLVPLLCCLPEHPPTPTPIFL